MWMELLGSLFTTLLVVYAAVLAANRKQDNVTQDGILFCMVVFFAIVYTIYPFLVGFVRADVRSDKSAVLGTVDWILQTYPMPASASSRLISAVHSMPSSGITQQMLTRLALKLNDIGFGVDVFYLLSGVAGMCVLHEIYKRYIPGDSWVFAFIRILF